MPSNHWFERHICGTNGAVAQLCQNSPQTRCCAVVRDYWTGHLYMHIQQRVWYPSRLLWPIAFKADLRCLVCNPHRLSFRASSVEAEVWWGKREGEEKEKEREREKMKEKILYTAYQRRHSISKTCLDHSLDHSVLIWPIAQRQTAPWSLIIPVIDCWVTSGTNLRQLLNWYTKPYLSVFYGR